MRLLSSSVLMLCMGALTACGPGAKLGGGREGAAHALAQANSALTRPPSNTSTSTSISFTGGPGGLDYSVGVTVDGRRGGSAKVTVRTAVSTGEPTSVGVDTVVVYTDFSEDGRTRYNGSVETHQSVLATSALAAIEVSMIGKLTMTGAIDDFIDVNISESVSVGPSAMGIRLTGTIATSDESFTYEGDALEFGLDMSLPEKPRE